MLHRTKDLLHSTAEFKVPFSAKGNGYSVGKGSNSAKKTRRAKPHKKNGLNQAACHAYGAVLLITRCGFTIEQAIACTGSHTNYIEAMKWVVASGDAMLLDDVLHGYVDIFIAAKRVRPLVELRAAYKKLTPKQRIYWAVDENPNILFNEIIVPASVISESMKSESSTETTTASNNVMEAAE